MSLSPSIGDRGVERGTPAAVRPFAARLAAVAAAAGVALLFRPHLGLFGDARIYVGHALAALDPAGVGRDMMFVYDRQSGFSLFPPALTRVVAALGPIRAAAAVSLLGLAVWTTAAALALRAVSGPGRVLVPLLCVLILPSAYGGFQFGVGEAAPLPRPFAEALVLLGLWALLRDRRSLAAALMAAAAAVHPIMALPGWGVLVLALGLQDRRWLLAACAAAAAVLAGALTGLPLLGRLTLAMDAQWLAVLRNCSPFLFLRDWSPEAWAQLVARAATLGVAAALLQGRARQVAVAALGVSALSIAAAALLGDGLSSVLVLQMQPWRGLWLLSFLSSAAAPLVAARLWGQGDPARLAVALLACAWAATALAPLSVAASAAAGLAFVAARRGLPVARPVRLAGWAAAVFGAMLALTGETLALLPRVWGVPEPLRLPLDFYLLQDVFRVAVAAALVTVAVAWSRRRSAPAMAPTAALAAATLLAAFGALEWRAPDSGRRLLASPEAARQVRAITAARPGEVQWLGGDLEPVMLAGRPAWWTEVQAASSVFSRDQAMLWVARRERLVRSGVGPPSLRDPFPHENPRRFWSPAPSAVRAFCAFPDAPAWLVTPLRAGAAAPEGAILWRAPVAVPRAVGVGGRAEPVAAYAFSVCRAQAPRVGRGPQGGDAGQG